MSTATARTDLMNPSFHFDPFDFALHDDPYPAYRRLRDEYPLYYNPQHKFYAVSRYADVMTVLRTFNVFVNKFGITLEDFIPGVIPFMLSSDPPDHTRLRHLLVDQFRPNNVAALENTVRVMARDLLEPHLAKGRIDIIDDFGAKLPMAIISALLGVPRADEDMVRGWTDDIVQRDETFNTNERNISGTKNTLEYFDRMIAERKKKGQIGDDIVGKLIRFESEGKVSHMEVLGYVYLLIIAGNETTTKMLGNLTYQLWSNPGEKAKLLADRSLAPLAVEETMRIDGPTQLMARTTVLDFEMHGHVIPSGAKVATLLISGNRDERKYPDPDAFRITRNARDHLGFGGGLHSCLGAALARLEGRIALEEMLNAMPDFEVDIDGAQRMHSANVRGYTHLPITFSPRKS